MKVVYICHPISGDVKGNLEKIVAIGREINLSSKTTIPFVPYYFDLQCLDDNVEEERAKGIINGSEMFRRECIDELWVYGELISNGMSHEIALAKEYGIKIVYK